MPKTVIAELDQASLDALENVTAVVDNGTKINAATMPTGGVGLIGWMSAAWYRLASLVGVAGTPSADVLSMQGITGGVPVPSSDSGPAWTTVATRTTSADMTTAANISGLPTSGQHLVVTDVIISTDTAMRFDLLEESTATPRYSFYMAANSSYQFTPRGKFKLPTVDKHLQGKASVAGNVSITTLVYSES